MSSSGTQTLPYGTQRQNKAEGELWRSRQRRMCTLSGVHNPDGVEVRRGLCSLYKKKKAESKEMRGACRDLISSSGGTLNWKALVSSELKD